MDPSGPSAGKSLHETSATSLKKVNKQRVLQKEGNTIAKL